MSIEQNLAAGILSDRFASVSEELRGLLGPDGTLLAASPSWARRLGWPTDELIDRPLDRIVHADDRDRLAQVLAETVGDPQVDVLELRLRHAAGGYRWLRCALAGRPEQAQVELAAVDVTREYRDRAARELIEQQAGIGTWELDLGTGRSVWSTMTHRLHGTDPAHDSVPVAVGLTYYPPQARPVIAEAFDRLVEHGEPYDLELPLHPVGGGQITIRTSGRAVVRDGVVVRVFGTIQDVTALVERDRYQQQLQQTTERLEESQRLARLGHWEADLSSGVLTWSPVVYEIFGFEPDRTVPTRDALMALVHPADRAALSAAGARAARTGEHTVDYRILPPDGGQRSIHQVGRTVRDGQGRAVRMLGTVQDVTELRRAERALLETQELLRRVLAATRDGWWEIDLAARSAYYSDRWFELYGYHRDELPDEPDLWRRLTHPEDLPRLEDDIAEVLARGEATFTLSSAGRHRDGHRVPMVVRGLVDYDDEGAAVRISGATEDVTEARQAEIAKQQFIATVSHELRTPLTSIEGALKLLEDDRVGPLPAKAGQLVAMARRNTARLRLLIDDLLALERLEADRQPFALSAQQLTPLLARTVQDHVPFAAEHDVRFVHLSGGPDVVVEVDAARLQQVLANYLSNAASFAPVGSEVTVATRWSPEHSDHVRVEVVDAGPGVPAELAERLFERFVQGDSPERRSRGGTGLGLAISREIVERLAGRVGFDSRPGHTCFWFDLPVVSDLGDPAVSDAGAGVVSDAGAGVVSDAGAGVVSDAED